MEWQQNISVSIHSKLSLCPKNSFRVDTLFTLDYFQTSIQLSFQKSFELLNNKITFHHVYSFLTHPHTIKSVFIFFWQHFSLFSNWKQKPRSVVWKWRGDTIPLVFKIKASRLSLKTLFQMIPSFLDTLNALFKFFPEEETDLLS